MRAEARLLGRAAVRGVEGVNVVGCELETGWSGGLNCCGGRCVGRLVRADQGCLYVFGGARRWVGGAGGA